jgi:hypothetical protein
MASRWQEASAAAKSSLFSTRAHALAAAAGAGLDQHRVADRLGLLLQENGVLVVAVVARRQRHAGSGPSAFLAADFEPMARIAEAGGPMKTIPAAAQASAKSSFSEKAVAGVDGLRAGHVACVGVGLGIDGDAAVAIRIL